MASLPLLRQHSGATFIDAARTEGRLELRGDCLMVGESAIVWPADAVASRNTDGALMISSESVRSRAIVGEVARFMGGETRERSDAWDNLAATGCRPPYWVAGAFGPAG